MQIRGYIPQFGYDSDGRRVSTTFDGVMRQHVWDETSAYGDVILELDGNGAPVNGYTLAGNRIVAQTDANHTASYFLQDALGSTRGLTSGSTVTQAYSYDAFGALLGDVGTMATNYLFAGQQYDSATGLYSMRARYYDPGVGRFLSRDTWAIDYANPVELNRYVYAANNPVRWSDPSGNNFIETIGLHFKNNATRYIGALNGAALGSLVGRLGAVAMYSAIMNNICGSKMRDELVSRQISSLDYMNQAANAGAFMGAWLGFAPETRGIIAGAGVVFSALAFADDPNACTLAQMLLAMAGGMSGKLTLGGGLELVVSNSGAAALAATSTLTVELPLAGVVSNGILEWVNFSSGYGGTRDEYPGYENDNPRQDAEERRVGELLDRRAWSGELEGVARVRGRANVSGQGRQPDYSFVGSNGEEIATADLERTGNPDPNRAWSNVFQHKSGQTRTVILERINEALNWDMNLEEYARSFLPPDQPGSGFRRIIIISGDTIDADVMSETWPD